MKRFIFLVLVSSLQISSMTPQEEADLDVQAALLASMADLGISDEEALEAALLASEREVEQRALEEGIEASMAGRAVGPTDDERALAEALALSVQEFNERQFNKQSAGQSKSSVEVTPQQDKQIRDNLLVLNQFFVDGKITGKRLNEIQEEVERLKQSEGGRATLDYLNSVYEKEIKPKLGFGF